MSIALEQVLQELDQRPTPAGYAHAARRVRALGQQLRPARIAQLSTFTLDGLTPYLEVETARLGFAVQLYQGPFNAVRQELLDPHSGTAAQQPDVVFVTQLLEDVCPPLARNFLALDEAQVERCVAETVEGLAAALRAFRNHSPAIVVLGNFVLPAAAALGIAETGLSASQTAVIHRINARLVDKAAALPGVYVLDFDRVCAEVGYQAWRHEELWYTARAPLATAALQGLARVQAAYVQALLAAPRKCLVVDLDNTLWGGVLGEEGLAGIQLGNTYPGNVYRDVQHALLQLYRRGVLLAINSKNNEADVDEVFRAHPEMILRREHFAAARINWRPKPENMLELADELNLGTDSLVFLDDSPAECGLMRHALPQVLTWETCGPGGVADPLRTLAQLRQTHVFDKLTFTADDRRRGAMYGQQAARRQWERSAASLEEFLQGLAMTADLRPVDDFSLPRVVDLLHKTNQFNLTTRRHSEVQLRAWAADPQWGLFTLRLTDRFGDNGLVGVAIVRQQDDTAEIDTLLLSCRVLGRRVETALLAHLASWAKQRGAAYLLGQFIPTAKNAPAAQFFADHGFTQIDSPGPGTRWLLSLDDALPEWPAFIAAAGEAAAVAPAAEDRLLTTVGGVLGVEIASLNDESSPATVSSWDSLNHLNLVLAIEAEYGVSLSPEEALSMQSVGRIRQVLAGPHDATPAAIDFHDCRADEVPALKEFIARSYGPTYVLGVNDDYFRWQYGGWTGTPAERYRLRLALVEGRIAGCLGYIPCDVNVAGQTLRGAWLANWMVAPEHRKLGVGPLLAREVAREFEITLALGANADAQNILARMGWTDFGMLQRYVAVLDRAAAAVLCETGRLDWPGLEDGSAATRPTDGDVRRVETFAGAAQDLWDRLRGGDAALAGTRRTTEFLNWRYARHPQFSYRLFEISRNGQLQGFAVHRVEQARDLPVRVSRLVEFVAEAEAADALLAAVLEDARAGQAVAMDFFCGSRGLNDLLARHGFLGGDDQRTRQIPVLYQPIDRRRAGIRFLADLRQVPQATAIKQWYVTKSDGDQDRPN